MPERFLKDTIKYLPSQITPAIVGFISIPIITSIFPPRDYGNYSIAMATLMVFTTILGWLPMSITRFYPIYDRKNKTKFFFNIIFILTIISVTFIIIIYIVLLVFIKKVISSDLFFLLSIGIGVLICLSFFNVFQNFLRIKRKINWYSGFAVWRSTVALGISLGLIFLLKLGIESLLLGIALSIIIIVPLLWKKASAKISIKFPKLDVNLIKKMSLYSSPLVIGNLAAWILSLSDRYILELYRGSKEVGIYSASYNISEKSIYLLTTLFMLASTPLLMHIWEKEGESKSKDFLNKVTRYYLIICVPAVVGLSVLSKPIVKMMTGEQYSEGYIIFPFVTFGVLFLGLQKRFNDSLLLYKKSSIIAFSIASAGLLNIILNFLLIPKLGYFAAAFTTFISYVFLLFLMVILSRRYFVWKFPFKSLINAIIASVIMGFFVFFVVNSLDYPIVINLLFSSIIGLIIYFAFLYLLRELKSEERDLIKIWLKNISSYLNKIRKKLFL